MILALAAAHPIHRDTRPARRQPVKASAANWLPRPVPKISWVPNRSSASSAASKPHALPGVFAGSRDSLLATLLEMADVQPRALASLAGLAPVTRQSGAWQNRSFIQGGRFHMRRLLYIPALAASRCNPDLAAFYQRPVQAGKPPKVALAAVMRKDREWSR